MQRVQSPIGCDEEKTPRAARRHTLYLSPAASTGPSSVNHSTAVKLKRPAILARASD